MKETIRNIVMVIVVVFAAISFNAVSAQAFTRADIKAKWAEKVAQTETAIEVKIAELKKAQAIPEFIVMTLKSGSSLSMMVEDASDAGVSMKRVRELVALNGLTLKQCTRLKAGKEFIVPTKWLKKEYSQPVDPALVAELHLEVEDLRGSLSSARGKIIMLAAEIRAEQRRLEESERKVSSLEAAIVTLEKAKTAAVAAAVATSDGIASQVINLKKTLREKTAKITELQRINVNQSDLIATLQLSITGVSIVAFMLLIGCIILVRKGGRTRQFEPQFATTPA